MPKRIQRKRTKGWKMPENCVYVGRPSRWGNPYRVGDPYPWVEEISIDQEQAVFLFDEVGIGLSIEQGMTVDEWLAPLRGKDLACWCKLDAPCHADVLLRLANS